MMRHKQRKTIEDLYGNKFDAAKSHVTSMQQNSSHRTGQNTERSYGYIISSNTPYNGAAPPGSPVAGAAALVKPLNTARETTRRKTARHSNKMSNAKQGVKEVFDAVQVMKDENLSYISTLTNGYDNKIYDNYKQMPANDDIQHHKHHHHHQQQQQQQQEQHQHQHHHSHQNQKHNDPIDDKDDDEADEFFDLIRRTVENAIGKSISELLNRSFRELSSKVDCFSTELKDITALLYQMQNELSNKIAHYGEENSSHYRYLCMKSEYDKVFYQQTLMANSKAPNAEVFEAKVKRSERRKSCVRSSKSTIKTQCKEDENITTVTATCNCRNVRPSKSSSGDMSHKSSGVGIPEVMERVQKTYTQVHSNDTKYEPKSGRSGRNQQRTIIRHENLTEADEEDDVWEISSDDMTPRNRSNDMHKYEGETARGDTTQRGKNGAGDG